MFGALRLSVKSVAVAAAAFASAGVTAAFAEPTSTPGKAGDYYVDLANGGYEVGYTGRDGKQVVEIYNKTGPALYKGPPNAKTGPAGIGGDDLTDEERVLLAQIKASVDAIANASK
eukprot:gene20855-7222_t